MTPYPLDNDDPFAGQHHELLGTLLDQSTKNRIVTAMQRARIGGLTGARCLEVGAGGGSVARWLATQVGPRGHVTALDLKPHHLLEEAGLTAVTLDLNGDDPLPGGPFDLIHARLVLSHLPKRRDILRRLAERLTLNGTILIGDWRSTNPDPVIMARNEADADLYRRYQRTVGEQVFASAGTDRDWAARTFAEMTELGLMDVQTTVEAEYWTGGSPGCKLVATLIEELWHPLRQAGLPERDLRAVQAMLGDPAFVVHGHPMYYTSARAAPC
jgi:SAM-dependent methyltransferase